MKDKNSLLKFILTTGLIIVIALLINKFNIFKGYGPKEIKDFIQGKGIMAPIIYVALLSSLPLLLFPDSVLVIAGGMIFGLFWGTVLTTVGSLIGAAISFYISRKLGQQVVKKLIKKDLVLFDKKNSGFFLILMLRLIPLFPFKIVSYSAGLSDVKFKDFALATTIGSLPGIIVYTNLGDKTTVFGSKDFYLSIGLLIGLFVISFIMKKIFQEKGEKINE
ncbi:TVP38/TMEM64 family protein [Tissierella praeacuta]|uniref:TVP38/TMEM64 family protein n=1 Tax=Tissierella praeacuta TaxID=43131 RepID=UPI000ED7CCEA|nr:TVP38/TMEM64 family protein [Tissierella praeacuta]MBU5256474.1 TVP38/TMEM64 family protein [Tissierella praeacuta]HAE92843.1 TVP38/TMEM64 family protein [Tissierella sp.]